MSCSGRTINPHIFLFFIFFRQKLKSPKAVGFRAPVERREIITEHGVLNPESNIRVHSPGLQDSKMPGERFSWLLGHLVTWYLGHLVTWSPYSLLINTRQICCRERRRFCTCRERRQPQCCRIRGRGSSDELPLCPSLPELVCTGQRGPFQLHWPV